MALGQHIRLRRKDDSIIGQTIREQRIVARAVLERGRAFGLIAFSAADTHLHMVTTCDHAAGEELARRVEIAISKKLRPKVGFVLAKVDAIDKQWHLHNLCDYVLRQDKRHNIEELDPLRECSNLPDLLGARLLGAYTLKRLKRTLPRFHEGDFLRLMGVIRLEPADGPPDLLLGAAAAAVCRVDLRGRSVEVSAALTAAVKVAGDQLPSTVLGRLLGISPPDGPPKKDARGGPESRTRRPTPARPPPREASGSQRRYINHVGALCPALVASGGTYRLYMASEGLKVRHNEAT